MTDYTIAKIAVTAITILCLWYFVANIVNDGYYYNYITSDPTRELSTKEKFFKLTLQTIMWIAQ